MILTNNETITMLFSKTIVFARWSRGESIQDLADAYKKTPEEIQEAIDTAQVYFKR